MALIGGYFKEGGLVHIKFHKFVIFSFQILINNYHYNRQSFQKNFRELLFILYFFRSLYTCSICILIYLRLHYTQISNKHHCVKSVLIRIFFWFVFPCIRARKNSVFGHFPRSAPHFEVIVLDWTLSISFVLDWTLSISFAW